MTELGAFERIFHDAAQALAQASAGTYLAEVGHATDILFDALSQGHRVLIFGNGGSAADALHIAGELVGRFALDRAPLPALALTANPAVLTACSNDHGFDTVFTRQVEALGVSGDVAWGISTSGRSANVVDALRRARELGLRTIGLTGPDGGELGDLCDVLMRAPGSSTPRVQEVHAVTYHAICARLEERLFT